MKKIKFPKTPSLIAIIIIAALALSGCHTGLKGAGKTAKELLNPFETSVEISYKGVIMSADIEKKGERSVISFTAPESLRGLVIDKDGDKLGMSLNGISFELTAPALSPSLSVLNLITSSITIAAEAEDENIAVAGEAIEISGKTDAGAVVVTMDRSSGALKSISIPNSSFQAAFKDFIYLN